MCMNNNMAIGRGGYLCMDAIKFNSSVDGCFP